MRKIQNFILHCVTLINKWVSELDQEHGKRENLGKFSNLSLKMSIKRCLKYNLKNMKDVLSFV